MKEFADVLLAKEKSNKIPEEYNYFAPMIGEWDFEWIDRHGTEQERHIKGEWIFSWILEGTAVQDIFICPSREERRISNQKDAEYGTTIRLYNPNNKTWDIFYGYMGGATRLEGKKEGDKIVLTEIILQNMKWVFSEITDKSFRWQNISTQDGSTWKLIGELFATKRK